MDVDPWADAPPSPRPDTPKQGSPSKPNPQVPLTETNSSPLAKQHFESLSIADQNGGQEVTGLEEGFVNDLTTGPSATSGFDEFDDFEQPQAGPSSPRATNGGLQASFADDDGFGDFGEFEEGEEAAGGGSGLINHEVVEEPQDVDEQWRALHLRPFPSHLDLLRSVSQLLSPVSSGQAHMTDEPPREVGGLGRIMIAESSRDAYAQLTTPPMLKSLDWTRSRVRREHLISMGVPVNLDEVDSHRLTALPPLRITTKYPKSSLSSPSTSMPPPPRPLSVDSSRVAQARRGKSRDTGHGPVRGTTTDLNDRDVSPNGTNGAALRDGRYGLGEKPVLDTDQAERLCGLDENALSLSGMDRLTSIQNELVEVSAQASALLAWYLQLKDAQTQDSETYNGMISELISNAARAKQAQSQSSGGVFRRSSTQIRPQSSSGVITPKRVGSPAIR